MNESTRISLPSPAVSSLGALPPADGAETAPQALPTCPVVLESASTALTTAAGRTNAAAIATAFNAIDRYRGTSEPSSALSLALIRARWWVETLADFLTLHRLAFQAPHVTTSADGEVVFEWWHGERKLTMYITGSAVEFIQVWGANMFTEMTDGPITSGSHAVALWRWLTWEPTAQ